MVVRQDEYIEHWGIRGMKWGHRRFQEYGGSARTTAGKIRYDEMPKGEKGSERAQKTARVRPSGSYANAKTSNKVRNSDKSTKSSTKKSNSGEDNNSKTTKTKADSKKNSKLSTASKVAIGAGVATLVGVGAYVGYKKISKNYVDKVLKAGLEMQTITTAENLDLGKRFYTSFEKSDMRRYKYFYGKQLYEKESKFAFWTGRKMKSINSIQTQLTKNMKVASHNSAAKVFQKLYNEDSNFSKVVDQMNNHFREQYKNSKSMTLFNSTKDRMTPNMLRTKGYEAFNYALVFSDQGTGIKGVTEAQNKFYRALKEAGYNAIQDINDQKYSGYHSKNPLIVFDSSNIVQKTIEELKPGSLDFTDNFYEVWNEIDADEKMEKELNNYLRYAAIGGASTAAVGMTGRNIDKRLQNRNANRR